MLIPKRRRKQRNPQRKNRGSRRKEAVCRLNMGNLIWESHSLGALDERSRERTIVG